jgi:uncharacterized membrane protein/osmotically-inducible protein OsmY
MLDKVLGRWGSPPRTPELSRIRVPQIRPPRLRVPRLTIETRSARRARRTREALLVGVGGGLMYLLDPVAGARRRAQVRDRATRLVGSTRQGAGVVARDAANRGKGLAAEMRGGITRRDLDDERITERIRSKLGYLVMNPSAIDVESEDGRVTLSGPVLENEADPLVRRVRRTRGVSSVEDRLDRRHSRGDEPGLQGAGRKPRRIFKENWAPTTRAAGIIGGGAVTVTGLSRKSPLGASVAAAGTALLGRSIFNMPLKRLVGIGGGRRAIDVDKTIHIAAPVEQVFDFWSDYGNFPRFMTHVLEVKPLEQGMSRWKIEGPAGAPIQFDAQVSAFEKNERFGWKTVEGSVIKHSGIVRFEDDGMGGTRVHVRMTYNPVLGGVGHAVAGILGSDPKKRLDDDLLRMKSVIETGRQPSDAAQATR